MRCTELNLLGVYVAPMMVAAWVLLLPVRGLAHHFGLLRCAWHPALSALVLLAGGIAG